LIALTDVYGFLIASIFGITLNTRLGRPAMEQNIVVFLYKSRNNVWRLQGAGRESETE